MEILEIIREAFIFPSKNLDKLAIYIVLTFLIGILIAGGVILGILGVVSNTVYITISIILMIITIIIGFIVSGYQISIIKSGINHDENAPSFNWLNDLITGVKLTVVGIVYFIIRFIIVAIVAWAVDFSGKFMNILQ